MSGSTKPRKPPLTPRQVDSDDLAVVVGGDTYYPHEGEWVKFKGRPSMGLWLKVKALGEEESSGGEEVYALLLNHIHSWSWTDDNGDPYENPPTIGTLLSLAKEEFGWLLAKLGDEGSGKN